MSISQEQTTEQQTTASAASTASAVSSTGIEQTANIIAEQQIANSITAKRMTGRQNKNITRRQDKDVRLIRAVDANDYELVVDLVERGIDLNIPFYTNGTAISRACGAGNFEIVRYLLKHGALINIKDSFGQTALHIAIIKRKFNIVNYILSLHIKGKNDPHRLINIADDFGQTPVHLIARFGQVDLLRKAVGLGGNLKAETYGLRQTPLFMAMENNQRKTVEYIRSVLKN